MQAISRLPARHPSEVTLAVKHNDGNMTLQLRVVEVEKFPPSGQADLTIISLKDKEFQGAVVLARIDL